MSSPCSSRDGTLMKCSVIYFNLGSHHVPHSGDLPNTLMHTSASSVMFTPFNFNDRDPSRRSSQGVRVDKNNGRSSPRYFGTTYNKGISLKDVSCYYMDPLARK